MCSKFQFLELYTVATNCVCCHVLLCMKRKIVSLQSRNMRFIREGSQFRSSLKRILYIKFKLPNLISGNIWFSINKIPFQNISGTQYQNVLPSLSKLTVISLFLVLSSNKKKKKKKEKFLR